jgi:hypothetical protein
MLVDAIMAIKIEYGVKKNWMGVFQSNLLGTA